jgi:serine/threonine protein kinase
MAQQPPRTSAPRAGSAASSAGGGRSQDKNHETFFLGRYRVVDEIGVGGMASVHLARMDGPGGFQKWVAIKRIHPHLVEDDQFVDMFLDEARIAAGINHANVAQVFDLGKDDNTYWIAMEYLHGEPLREVMRRCEERQNVITPELAARICADAAEGLHAAHELRGKNGQLLGLVHRDVTPHNLFCTYDGYTKVVDFGIAKVADRLASTRAGTLKGKLAYMSPEQVRGAEVDRTTDIFALGVVLWELTTGHRLFRMDTDLDTLEKVQACVVPPPSTIHPDYPVELESVVMKALAKRKEDRYPTARELSRALQGYLMRRGIMVGPEEVAVFTREVFSDRIQKREAHLAWASEVTSTVDIAHIQLPKGRGPMTTDQSIHSMGSQASAVSMSAVSMSAASVAAPLAPPGRTPAPPRVAPPPPPSSPVLPRPPSRPPHAGHGAGHGHGGMAGSSLTDEEEDIPTTIAMRDDAAQALAPRRPGGGPPAPQPDFNKRSSAPTQALGNNAQNGAPSFGQAPTFGRPPPSNPGQGGPQSQGMPGLAPMGMQGQQGQQGAPMFGLPPMGAPPQPLPMTQTPQAPPAAPNLQGRPQAAIETVMSMPRPDAATLWLAKQDVTKGQASKQSLAVLVSLSVLTAICVAGLATLLYLKLVAPPAVAAEALPSAKPGGAAPLAASPPSDAVVAKRTTSTAAPRSTGATAAPAAKPATGNPGASPATTSAPGEEPGFLTIICKPFCDDVLRGGQSLGPSPVVKSPVPPGQHRITLKRAGSPDKIISVLVSSGEVHKETIAMK